VLEPEAAEGVGVVFRGGVRCPAEGEEPDGARLKSRSDAAAADSLQATEIGMADLIPYSRAL
jgi:hypothetical protein